ncbi:hypothetical protein BJ962_003774 [Streptomyces aureorectus]|nr:hypothetical protein [Streptomyces calvus]
MLVVLVVFVVLAAWSLSSSASWTMPSLTVSVPPRSL